jgi:hypothetical protein
MLENMFLRYIGSQHRLQRWVIRKIADYMDWEPIDTRMKPFKMADDLQRKAFNFQLSQMGKISDATLLSDSDFDPDREDELIKKETNLRADAQKKSRLAQAEIEGESQMIMMRYQLKAQQEQMQMQQSAAPAPGEPGAEAEPEPEVQEDGGDPLDPLGEDPLPENAPMAPEGNEEMMPAGSVNHPAETPGGTKTVAVSPSLKPPQVHEETLFDDAREK